MAREKTALQVVGDALRVKPETLRYRLSYYQFKFRGKTVPQIVAALQAHTKTKFTPAMLRKLNGKLNGGAGPPPVHANPTAEAPARAAPRSNNLRLAVMALTRVERMILPLVPGHYDERELLELEALTLLRKLDKA